MKCLKLKKIIVLLRMFGVNCHDCIKKMKTNLAWMNQGVQGILEGMGQG